ncbi:MAG: hypothetical protein ACMUIE_07970 [Thermoplasmatota archaeon]
MTESSKGSTRSIGEMLHSINSFIFEKNKVATSIVAIILIPILTGIIFSIEANKDVMGLEELKAAVYDAHGDRGKDFSSTESYIEKTASSSESGQLNEGSSRTFTLAANESKVITGLKVTLSWTDETNPPSFRVRRYDNQPDTFSVRIGFPGGTNWTQAITSDSGRVEASLTLVDEQIEEFFDAGDFTVEVSLVTAGDWTATVSLGFLDMPDNGNDFDISIQETYLAPP